MEKHFTVKHLMLAAVCAVFLVSNVQTARAAQPGAGISPELFQGMMQLAGFEATLQHEADAVYPCTVTVQAIKNISFALGFPAGGIKKHTPFYLATDEYAAVVQFTDEGRLVVVDGDERIIATGAFGMIVCIVSSVGFMVSGIVAAALINSIQGILAAVFTGVVSILTCIFALAA